MTRTSPLAGRAFAAFLFDMDGTVLSSIRATERVWGAWARSHGLDVAAFLPTVHGVRAIDTIRRAGVPGIDVDAEAAVVARGELEDVDGIEPIAGAPEFLRSLPPDRWAVVTSATRDLAARRLHAAGLVPPAVMVTADDVSRGKPAPDCFVLAAERLGVDVRECLVFEDAAAGIAAAEAAGAAVLVITATHAHPMASAHPAASHFIGLEASAGAGGLMQLRLGGE